jgi:helicase required for RNAi-mediated heterochromatin assembly 1
VVELDREIGVPDWLQEQRFLNLSSLIRPGIEPNMQKPGPIPTDQELSLYKADVLQGFPHIPSSGMDESQIAACERMVTKKVSIVQGPPGTGKTFTSVSALRVLIENLGDDSPPIIIVAQTNHALDQLMNQVLVFEPNILRLGSRSNKENIEILKRTLYVLRSSTRDVPNGYKGMKPAKTLLENLQQEIQMSMAPLLTQSILCDQTLLQTGIITEAQRESLYEEGWVNGEESGSSAGRSSPFGQCKYFKSPLRFYIVNLILLRGW